MLRLFLLQASAPADWVLFWGRFHPLVVHLPIGFLLIAGLLELDRLIRRNSVSSHTITLILFWSAVSATMACVFGYLLSLGGGYDTETLSSHMWAGLGVALFAWIAWAVKSENPGRIIPFARLVYLPVLAVSVVFLLTAGHQGGNLTHGSDYLTQYAPAPIRTLAGLSPKQTEFKAEPITDVRQAMVYQQIVNPILQTRCVQCHNADKAKAGLRLDTPDMIKKGYEDGPVLVIGKGSVSELVKVCLLPEEDDHHMPPKGKTQLTADQITLLTWWIDQGAPVDKRVADLTISNAAKPVLATLGSGKADNGQRVAGTPAPVSPVLTMNVPAADPKAVAALTKAALLVMPLSKEMNQLEVSAINAPSFSDAQALGLSKLSQQIVWLKLGNTDISDATLVQVATLKNLQKLHLEHTKITDAGLKNLTNLPYLDYLNLYGTAVSDAGLQELASIKQLKSIYLWQTNVTAAGVAALRKALPGVDIDTGIAEPTASADIKVTKK